MDSSEIGLSNSFEECPSIDLVNDIDERCAAWRFSLIGRLDLLRMKFSDAVLNLKKQWRLEGQCKMIPLGKVFFTIKLDNERDKNLIKVGKWEVLDQVLWIRNWIPDFCPENHRTSSAMIWVHFPGLSLEYWDEKTFFTIRRALRDPVKFDGATLSYENGYYARIHCKIVGHFLVECRIKKDTSKGSSNQHGNGISPKSALNTHSTTSEKFDNCETSKGTNSQMNGNSPKDHVREKFDIC
ncbi:uncharacterized protein LOC113351774 [Papaver somniferum]|uniref:uncharacterized protein LOC113351774 n=1 Tax=Papaver somniferum TaxID=3469 RepID=UPI000E6FB780|nr:uncharacterized protein LOC113351774 [Papaver somniferum]